MRAAVVQVRRLVRTLRPSPLREAFLHLHSLPGEAGQVGRLRPRLPRQRSAPALGVLTLSYSRLLYVEFFFDQTLANFLRGHVRAFEHFGGVPRHLPSAKIWCSWPPTRTSGFSMGSMR
jgi:transposase